MIMMTTTKENHLFVVNSLLEFDTARYGDFNFDSRFRICQPLLKSDTRNKSVQNQSFISFITVSFSLSVFVHKPHQFSIVAPLQFVYLVTGHIK